MKEIKRFEMLTRLTDVRLQADQARMAELLAHEAELRQTLQDLAAQRQKQSWPAIGAGDAAAVARADLHWQLWIDQRRNTINTELARVLAQKEECKATLRISFGRDQAAQRLWKTANVSAKEALIRKARYES